MSKRTLDDATPGNGRRFERQVTRRRKDLQEGGTGDTSSLAPSLFFQVLSLPQYYLCTFKVSKRRMAPQKATKVTFLLRRCFNTAKTTKRLQGSSQMVRVELERRGVAGGVSCLLAITLWTSGEATNDRCK